MLFDLFRKLYDICMSDKKDVAYGPVVEELLAYTVDHFSAEESHMKDMLYPGIMQHLLDHNEFVKKIEELKGADKPDNSEFCLDLILHVVGWIYDHVIVEDKKFAEYSRCR